MGPIEWSVPFTLTSPHGTLDLNADSDTRIILLPDQCQAGPDLRITKDAIPQADGEIFHRRFKTGYTMRLTALLLKDSAIAMGSDLVEIWDELLLHLDALLNPSLAELVSQCRIQWTPSGSADDWMLDRIRLLERPAPSGVLPKTVTFAFDTELPYVMRADQTTTNVTASAVLTNDGNTSFFPVIKVYGPSSAFTITNASALDVNGNPKQIVFLGDDLPGGADLAADEFVEINTFFNTVVLNGDETFASIAGIDITSSDLSLPLVPGANVLTITGATMDVLWQPAKA